MATASSAALPTNARSRAAMFALLLALIMYIDRVTLAQAAPFITKDLGLTDLQMGLVFSMFGWAYALFEIPGGWMGDRFGSRKVLMRIVIWWSAFTVATGMVWSWASLAVTQVLFGVGEAGCFPNLTRVLTTWLPKKEREQAQARLWLATRFGAALTPILVMVLLRYMGLNWRVAFGLFGLFGVAWAVAFYRWYRDDPATHPGVNAAELALLPPRRETAAASHFPIGELLSNGSVLLLCLQYACLAYGWWFYVTWLPTMVRQANGTSIQLHPLVQPILTGLPLLFGGIGCLVSGALAPRLARHFNSVTIARRLLAIVGFVGASASIVLFIQIHDPIRAMFVLGFAGFFNDFVMPAAWASTMDKGGRFAGTVSGTMNMVGGIAGASSPLIVAFIRNQTGGEWSTALYVSAGVYMIGAVCWLFIDPHTPIEQANA